MKIETLEDGTLNLKEVFNGIQLESESGNTIGICMRDNGFEIIYKGKIFEAKDDDVITLNGFGFKKNKTEWKLEDNGNINPVMPVGDKLKKHCIKLECTCESGTQCSDALKDLEKQPQCFANGCRVTKTCNLCKPIINDDIPEEIGNEYLDFLKENTLDNIFLDTEKKINETFEEKFKEEQKVVKEPYEIKGTLEGEAFIPNPLGKWTKIFDGENTIVMSNWDLLNKDKSEVTFTDDEFSPKLKTTSDDEFYKYFPRKKYFDIKVDVNEVKIKALGMVFNASKKHKIPNDKAIGICIDKIDFMIEYNPISTTPSKEKKDYHNFWNEVKSTLEEIKKI